MAIVVQRAENGVPVKFIAIHPYVSCCAERHSISCNGACESSISQNHSRHPSAIRGHAAHDSTLSNLSKRWPDCRVGPGVSKAKSIYTFSRRMDEVSTGRLQFAVGAVLYPLPGERRIAKRTLPWPGLPKGALKFGQRQG